MKKTLSIIITCCSLIFMTNSFAKTLEFKNCVDMTLSQNPNIKISDSKIKQSQYAYQSAQSSRYPKVSVSLIKSKSNNALNVFGMKLQQRQVSFNDFGFSEFGSDTSVQPKALNNPEPHEDVNARIEVLVPIWNGGKISAYQEQSHRMFLAAKKGNIAAKQILIFNVYKAYEGIHTSKAYIDVATKAVESSKLYVKTTQNLVTQGIVVKSELLSAKVHLAEAQTLLEDAKAKKQISLDSLKMLMNQQDMKNFDIGKRITITLPFKTVSKLLDKALKNNPSLIAKQQQSLSQQSAVKVEESSLYPSFNLSLRNDWNSEDSSLDQSSYTVAGVMSWNITDFGLTRSKVNQAKELADQQKLALSAARNNLRFKIQKAWRILKVAQKQEHLNTVSQAQAQESQTLVLKRYKNGVTTLTEVLASQTRLNKSRADLIKAIYNANLQRSILRLLTGTMNLTSLNIIK